MTYHDQWLIICQNTEHTRSSNNDPSSVHVGPRNSTNVASFDANGNEGPPQRYKVSYSAKGDGLALSGQPLTTRNLTEHKNTDPSSSRRYANGQALDRPQALEAALLQLEVDVSSDTLARSARDYAGMKPLARFLVEEGYWCPARRDPHSARGPST